MAKRYTNHCFRGRYGFSVIYGANAAIGLGIAEADGKGNFVAKQATNVGGGNVLPMSIVGTYSLNPDGSGTASVTITMPDGSRQAGNFYYVVLQAVRADSGLLAVDLQGMTVEPFNGALGLSHFKSIP
jgi:hypothetical protein